MLVSAVEEQICVMKKLILLCNRGYFLSLIKNTASSNPSHRDGQKQPCFLG